MSYFIELKLSENTNSVHTYSVKKLRCVYERPYNSMSPSASPRCTGIEVTVASPEKTDLFLNDWYISNRKVSGTLDVVSVVALNKKDLIRNIATFKSAVCYYYGEIYSSDEDRYIILHFDADRVATNNIVFKHL